MLYLNKAIFLINIVYYVSLDLDTGNGKVLCSMKPLVNYWEKDRCRREPRWGWGRNGEGRKEESTYISTHIGSGLGGKAQEGMLKGCLKTLHICFWTSSLHINIAFLQTIINTNIFLHPSPISWFKFYFCNHLLMF